MSFNLSDKLTELIHADDVSTLKMFLKNHIVNDPSNILDFLDAFSLAAKLNKINILDLLINRDIVDFTHAGHIALVEAVNQGNPEVVEFIFNHEKFVDSDALLDIIISAIRLKHFDIALILIKDKRIALEQMENIIITTAIMFESDEITDFVWKDKKVRKTLKNDNLKLYQELLKKDMANQILNFN